MGDHPSPRLLNRRRIQQEIAERRDRVTSYPYEIQWSGEHRCNLRCIQCGATVERNQGIVPLMDERLPVRSLERFQKLAEQLPYWEWLSLTGSGETLISPDLPALLEILSGEREARVSFNTNGTLWNRERAKMVVEARVDEIRFSMDGATKETFERIRVNAKFPKVLEAIRTLIEVRDEMGSPVPKVSFSCNFMRQNIEELPMLVDLAAEMGAETLLANNTIIFDPKMADEALNNHRDLARRMTIEAARRAKRHGLQFVNFLSDVAGEIEHEVDASSGVVVASTPTNPVPDVRDPIATSEDLRATDVEPATTDPTQGTTHGFAPEVTAPPPSDTPDPDKPEPTSQGAARPHSAIGTATEAPGFSGEDRIDDSQSIGESILPPMEDLPADLPPIVHACQRPWTGLYVENNGWVKVCCFDAPPIGNLDQQSFEEIWNGPLARELRKSFLENRPPEGCRNCFIFAKSKPEENVFVQSMIDGRCFIDEPGLDPRVSGTTLVHGWAVSTGHVDRIEIWIDDAHFADAIYGHERPDVIEVVPGFPEGPNCGFRFDLDTTKLAVGEHRLTIRAHDREGGVQEGPVRVLLVAR